MTYTRIKAIDLFPGVLVEIWSETRLAVRIIYKDNCGYAGYVEVLHGDPKTGECLECNTFSENHEFWTLTK